MALLTGFELLWIPTHHWNLLESFAPTGVSLLNQYLLLQQAASGSIMPQSYPSTKHSGPSQRCYSCRSTYYPWKFTILIFHSYNLQTVYQTEKDLWDLYHEYGASPRSLFAHAHQPDIHKAIVDDEIGKLSVLDLERLLRRSDAAVQNSHYVITTGPLPVSEPTSPTGLLNRC